MIVTESVSTLDLRVASETSMGKRSHSVPGLDLQVRHVQKKETNDSSDFPAPWFGQRPKEWDHGNKWLKFPSEGGWPQTWRWGEELTSTRSPLFGGFPGTSSWEKTPGPDPKLTGGITFIHSGLGTSQDPPGGAGERDVWVSLLSSWWWFKHLIFFWLLTSIVVFLDEHIWLLVGTKVYGTSSLALLRLFLLTSFESNTNW